MTIINRAWHKIPKIGRLGKACVGGRSGRIPLPTAELDAAVRILYLAKCDSSYCARRPCRAGFLIRAGADLVSSRLADEESRAAPGADVASGYTPPRQI